ncbi:MAG TPA: MoaD/ThiS family protein [Thermoanaerobaculia bacterium]|nr:MoaD/ThiS family protein [Thermoanaerobaculia bacterium]
MTGMIRVRLLLFAVLRDIVGSEERLLSLPDGATALDVWNELRRDHGALGAYERPPLTAVNQEYAAPESRLHDGDELAFIPPVSGG